MPRRDIVTRLVIIDLAVLFRRVVLAVSFVFLFHIINYLVYYFKQYGKITSLLYDVLKHMSIYFLDLSMFMRELILIINY